jgi:hypothetical protein
MAALEFVPNTFMKNTFYSDRKSTADVAYPECLALTLDGNVVTEKAVIANVGTTTVNLKTGRSQAWRGPTL